MDLYKRNQEAYKEIDRIVTLILTNQLDKANILSIKLDLISKHGCAQKAVLQYIKERITESNGLLEERGGYLVKVQD
jgi:hypothetical protein